MNKWTLDRLRHERLHLLSDLLLDTGYVVLVKLC